MRSRWGTGLVVCLLLAGCGAPRVTRDQEIERLSRETNTRFEALEFKPGRPLTLAECEAIALKNNLDYRVQLLQTRLRDDQVRAAMAGWLPKLGLEYAHSKRSNEPLVSVFGAGGGIMFEDQEYDRLGIRTLLPIFDFGNTFYAWQMTKDRRVQDRLVTLRARQTLLRDVRVRYARLAALMRQEELWKTAVVAAQELLKVAQSYEREGLGSPADTAQVEVTLAQAGRQLLLARNRLTEASLLLAQVLSIPAHTEFTIDPKLPDPPPALTDERLKELEEHALRARPELFVQDLQRHLAATAVRKEIVGFLPNVNGMANFDWSSLSQQVNAAYFTFGLSVAQSLFDGSRLARISEAKKARTVEEERALLLGLGVIYEVDLNALQLSRTQQDVMAQERVVKSREVVVKQISSRYREGLEAGADLAREVADLHYAMLLLDVSRTEHYIANFELESAAVIQEETPRTDGRGPLLPEENGLTPVRKRNEKQPVDETPATEPVEEDD
jgi:outer membrane protein TolC